MGCVALMMACVLCGMWVRSGREWDYLHFNFRQSGCSLGSVTGGLKLIRTANLEGRTNKGRAIVEWSSGSLLDPTGIMRRNRDWTLRVVDRWEDCEMDWRWDWNGFHFGVGTKLGLRTITLFEFPYSVLVLSLTLLSAYLLLRKPRTMSKEQPNA